MLLGDVALDDAREDALEAAFSLRSAFLSFFFRLSFFERLTALS
jgi:hypothetical protein